MNDILLYPVTAANYCIFKYIQEQNSLTIPSPTSAFVDKNYLQSGNNSLIWDETHKWDISFYSEWAEVYENVHTMIILPLIGINNPQKAIEMIKHCILKKIDIYLINRFDQSIMDELMSLSFKEKTKLVDLNRNANSIIDFSINDFSYSVVYDNILEICKPIVTITSLPEYCKIIDLQLEIRKRFLNSPYKFVQIANFNFAESLGFYSFPDFVFSPNYSNSQKVIFFNRYLKYIETKENCDLIIIAIPDPLLPYNEEYTCKFGILPFMLLQAYTSDYNIVAINYDEYNLDYFNEIKQCLNYRFQLPPNAFVMSDVFADIYNPNDERKVLYYSMPHDKVKKEISRLDRTYFLMEKQNIDALYNDIIATLSANILDPEGA